jgi:hypothetical protein
VIGRPNVGRESETYLHHILNHYENLPEFVVFLQGNPFDHCRGLLAILKEPPEEDIYMPLGGNSKHEWLTGEFNWEGFKECLRSLADFVGVNMQSLMYPTGAQCIVPRAAILARPKSFYEELLRRVNYSVDPLEGWAMERLWPYVFGYKNITDKISVEMIPLQGARDHVLYKAQDLVCILRTPVQLPPSFADDMKETYYRHKHEILKEDDPVFISPAFVFTSRNILVQHWSKKDEASLPGATHFQERGVPVFTRSG